MTKSLKALCVLFFALILLSGCTSAKRSALKTDFSADFSAGYHGQKLCGNLTYNRQGRMNLRINSPETRTDCNAQPTKHIFPTLRFPRSSRTCSMKFVRKKKTEDLSSLTEKQKSVNGRCVLTAKDTSNRSKAATAKSSLKTPRR